MRHTPMRRTIARVLLIGTLLAGAAFAAQPPELSAEPPNARHPAPNRIASGAVDRGDLERLRAAGVEHVVNLRTPEEQGSFDEAKAAASAGLTYHQIPIKGAQSLTRENAQKLDAVLAQIGDDKAIVHCASGNRVGALIAVREAWLKGRSSDEALAEGRRWGLTSLEPAVKKLLQGR